MCGRFLLDREIREIIKKYKLRDTKVDEYDRGDFYPSKDALIVLEDGSRSITLAKWGFTNSNNKGTVINARAESIMNKPMFKNSFYSARCIIPANLFYEWKDEGNRKKVKYRIGLQDDSLISLGGIYKLSIDEDLQEQITFVIITTESEGAMKAIHHRTPLIIKDYAIDLWINKNTSTRLVEKILKSNTDNKFLIESCETEPIKSNSGENNEQLRMF